MGVLDQPLTAVAFGVVAGLGIIGILLLFPKLVKTGDPMSGMAASVGGVLVSTLAGLVALYAYSQLADEGFVWFGVSTVAGYMVGIVLYTVRVIRK